MFSKSINAKSHKKHLNNKKKTFGNNANRLGELFETSLIGCKSNERSKSKFYLIMHDSYLLI
jgi:hypothetical protein